MMAEDNNDLLHKMSKKIAQLTKVIFYLNTKNDEYEYNLKSIISAYELEIEQLVKESNTSIIKYKEMLNRAQKNEELESQLRNFQEKIDLEKSKSIVEFANYRRSVEEKETKLTKENNVRIETYKSEIENLKSKLENLLKTIDKIKDNQENMTKNHKKEMADYVTEQNAKYTELLKSKLDLEDLLKDKTKSIEALKKELDKLNDKTQQDLKFQKLTNDKSANELKNYYEKKLSEIENNLSNWESKYKELENVDKENKKRISDLMKEIDGKNKEIEMMRNNSEGKSNEVSSLFKKIAGLEQDINKYKGDWLNEKNKVSVAEQKIKTLEDKINSLTAEKQKLQIDLNSAQEKSAKDERMYTQKIEELKAELARRIYEIEELRNQNKGLALNSEGETSKLLQEIRRKDRRVEELENEVSNIKNEKFELDIQKNKELEEVKSHFEKEKQELIDNYETKILQIVSQYDEKINSLADSHSQILKQTIQDFQLKIKNFQEKHENDLNDLRKEFDGQLKNRSSHESNLLCQLDSLKEKYSNLEKEHEILKKENSVNLETINLLRKEIEKLNNEINELKIKISKSESENQRLRNDGNNETENLRDELTNLRKEMAQKILDLQELLEKEIIEHEMQMKNTIKSLNDENQYTVRRLKEDFDLEKSILENEKNKRIRDLENEIANMKRRNSDNNSDWSQKIDSINKYQEKFQADLKEAHLKELSDREANYKEEIKKLKWEQEKSLKNLEAQKALEKQSALKDLLDQKNEEISDLKKQNEQKLQKLSKSMDMQLSEKIKEYEQKLQKMEERLNHENKAHNETKIELSKNRDESEKKIKNNEEIIRNMKRFQEGLQEEMSSMKEDLLRQRAEFEGEVEELVREKKKIEEIYNAKEVELKEKLKRELVIALKSQMAFIENMKAEYHNLMMIESEKYRELNENYEDLKNLFDQRPSRPEDLEKIKVLKREIELRDEEISKMNEKMKFFKLELINREMNYNKIFNANPHVGVLNPLENKANNAPPPLNRGLSSQNNQLISNTIAPNLNGAQKNPRNSMKN